MTFDESALPDVSEVTVGILGGTGPQGRGLAYRFARGGLTVRIGSRNAERGERTATELSELPGATAVSWSCPSRGRRTSRRCGRSGSSSRGRSSSTA
ncbi:hypothetical protein GCM10009558_030120 [Virgisporangium aurantiacum]